MRILIAEDDPTSRRILEKTLQKLGHEVVAVADGREAWAALQLDECHCPILISDWMMPELDGIEITRRVRAAAGRRYTYVILLTTLGTRANYLEGMEAGADDFLTKPFDLDQLRARLRVAERVLALQAEVSQLYGLLPMCAYCRQIRNVAGAWQTLETYVAQQTGGSFSHLICPECIHMKVTPEAFS